MSSERYLPIDEEGYFIFDGRRVDDEGLGQTLLKNIKPTEKDRLVTSMDGKEAWVEAFDEPLLVKHVKSAGDDKCVADLPYRTQMQFSLGSLSIDEWDRFHGVMENGVPFVFSRGAQVEFFELLEEFDDESITVGGKRYPTPSWLGPNHEPNTSQFWTSIYKTEPQPGWELGRETSVLPLVLPQLKLTRQRVLVLGCGSGHDAAFFARQGHVVTAVDFSDEAIERARGLYSEIENLKIMKADAFKLGPEFNERFDFIFEHTFYCAVSPERRNEIVKLWTRLLAPQGHLLGVFFVNEKRLGPPFGGSEWEVRERLKGRFDFMFWTRWRQSLENRRSKELVLYARKK